MQPVHSRRVSMFALALALVPGMTVALQPAAHAVTVSGKAAGLNLQQRTFWINHPGGQPTKVLAAGASIRYRGRSANLYRMIGSPYVRVNGSGSGGLVHASRIDITSGPTERLQESSYTHRAQPPFSRGELVPLHRRQ